jgi:FkbM family methyltransferase
MSTALDSIEQASRASAGRELEHRRAGAIVVRSGGDSPPRLATKLLLKTLFAARQGLRVVVEVADGSLPCRFVCTTWREVHRATALLSKEPGTIGWLRRSLRPGDTVLDVGANIGIYSIYAARSGGPRVRVFAVEPHLLNASRLIENVDANGLREQVRVLALALSDGPGVADFKYREWSAGSSLSQLGRPVDQRGRAFIPAVSELKLVTSVDDLVERGVLPPPSLVKIDVDGAEPAVVAGMARLLRSRARPRAVQVEVGPLTFEPIAASLSAAGYRFDHRHFTRNGRLRLERGEPADRIVHNALFVPADAAP